MVEVLGGLGDLRFGLDGLLQGADGGIGGDFEGEEISILVSRSSDVYCDTPSPYVSRARVRECLRQTSCRMEGQQSCQACGGFDGLLVVYANGFQTTNFSSLIKLKDSLGIAASLQAWLFSFSFDGEKATRRRVQHARLQ